MAARTVPITGFALLFVAIVALGYLAWRFFDHTHLIDGLIGGLIGSILTLLVAYVAWVQLGSISRTASADFILRFKKDFFQDETRRLIQLIDNDWLKFTQRKDQSFFQVDAEAVWKSELHEEIKNWLLQRKAYSDYDIDDLLLGHFEDLGMLRQARVLDFRMTYEMFSWYIEIVWENEEIQKYIKSEQEGDESIYEAFEGLYEECKET